MTEGLAENGGRMKSPLSVNETLLIGAGCIALVLLCARLYWPGLGGPLIFDDFPQLSPLLVLDPGPQLDWRGYVTSNSGLLGRPVAMASFLMNALGSGPDISAWKYTNVMIHLLTGLVLIWLSACLFAARQRGAMRPLPAWTPALVVGGSWMLHPLHVSTVLSSFNAWRSSRRFSVLPACCVTGRGGDCRSPVIKADIRWWCFLISSSCRLPRSARRMAPCCRFTPC